MRKRWKKNKIVVAFLLAFGVFIGFSNNVHTDSPYSSTEVISILSDELIGGDH